jgi:hypothetical protein
MPVIALDFGKYVDYGKYIFESKFNAAAGEKRIKSKKLNENL